MKVAQDHRSPRPIHTAEQLNHSTYEVGSGYSTKNREVVEAIMRVIRVARQKLGGTP